RPLLTGAKVFRLRDTHRDASGLFPAPANTELRLRFPNRLGQPSQQGKTLRRPGGFEARNASTQRELNGAWMLDIMIYLHVASVRVLRCFFGNESARAIVLLPQD